MDLSSNSQGEEAFSKQMLKLNVNVNDIDKDDSDNPQLVSEYVNDIYHYLRHLEAICPIRSQHLANQTEINGRMRGILIDWLVQVHLRFHLLQETLYLTVAIIDRYLQVSLCISGCRKFISNGHIIKFLPPPPVYPPVSSFLIAKFEIQGNNRPGITA